jgi:hypothetical protein
MDGADGARMRIRVAAPLLDTVLLVVANSFDNVIDVCGPIASELPGRDLPIDEGFSGGYGPDILQAKGKRSIPLESKKPTLFASRF